MAHREVGVGRFRAEEELHAALYRRDLHRALIESRRIQQKEIAEELGVSREAVGQYFRGLGSDETSERIDKAITTISDRRGLTPGRVVWPTTGLWPDGLPDVFTPEDGYRREMTIRDLMRAPGKSL